VRSAKTRARTARRRKGARADDPDIAIDKRISAGEDPESFLCIDCVCWSLDPLLCDCWTRALFPEN
jgi:hypothetical protein